TEEEAFEAYVDAYGEDSVLLIDTYDTLEGAELATKVSEKKDVDIRGVRIDSGDLTELSQRVKDVVEDMGVFVSSGLDEYRIRDFFQEGGVSSGFGVGTRLVTSRDAPAIEGVYKLVASEEDGEMQPQMKLSEGKTTWPGRKSVRRREEGGKYTGDTLGQADEELGGELLVQVFEDGELVRNLPGLEEVRERAERERRKLPERVRDIENPQEYPVEVSDQLQDAAQRLEQELSKR
ncbi:MAG: nicotinate phosphoribosyltransferase, partial [Candidatus Nanohaloarchaea archaeon]|nr:nicotinate phosphoribosyltransferase [Candidatus Nanohaloarchaea archaeon]